MNVTTICIGVCPCGGRVMAEHWTRQIEPAGGICRPVRQPVPECDQCGGVPLCRTFTKEAGIELGPMTRDGWNAAVNHA
jgi:hypothetical protein